MKKRDRIRAKFGGKCAYCGQPLQDRWHMDHAKPLSRGFRKEYLEMRGREKGEDTEDNLFPACPRCNLRKAMMTIEEFRLTIYNEISMLKKYNDKYRLAEDYGLIQETGEPVVFWFEKEAQDER